MKQVVSFFLVCWTIFAVMYHVDAGKPATSSAPNAFFDSKSLLTEEEAISIHNLLKDGGPKIQEEYEAIEEEPEFQIEMYSVIYREDRPEWHDTLLSLGKLQNNLILAELIFSAVDQIPYSSKSISNPIPRRLVSNVYRGKTSSKSNKSLEECRSIANMMLGYILPRIENWSPMPNFFKSYLGVANAEDVEELCREVLESIPVLVEGATDEYSGLRSICSAIQKNPSMQTAFVHPSAFSPYQSECYKVRGVCTDEELRKMMESHFSACFGRKSVHNPGYLGKLLDYKLRKTDFNGISLAFKRFATIYGENFSPTSIEDRDRLVDFIPTSLKDKALEVFRKATPKELQNMLAKGSLEEEHLHLFLEFLNYEPYNYLGVYGEIAETDERQVRIYEWFLRGKSQYDNNLVVSTKFRSNLLLFGLIFVEHKEENQEFWKHFPNVHVTPFSENKSGAVEDKGKGKGKEKEKENANENENENEKGKEEEKQQLFVQQNMSVIYHGDYFSERVDDKVFADMYQATLGEQEVGKQEVGKQFAMIMLRNALAHYDGVSKISKKLAHFVLVADADGMAQLLQIFLDTKSNALEIINWIQHLKNLKANPNYIAAIVQLDLFKITEVTCFKAVDGCTDKDLRAILLKSVEARDRSGDPDPLCIILKRLSFDETTRVLKDLVSDIGRFLNSDKDSDWWGLERALPKIKLLMEPIGLEQEELDIHKCDSSLKRPFKSSSFSSVLKMVSLAEERILQNITDEQVIKMLLLNYKDLPQDSNTGDRITRDFASRIMEWLRQSFLEKFPGHFLVDTLKAVEPDLTPERWIYALAYWQQGLLLRNRNEIISFGNERILREAIVELVMRGFGNAEKAIRAQIVGEAGGFTDHKTQQLVAGTLAEFSNGTLLNMFHNSSTQMVRLFMVQPRLFHDFGYDDRSRQRRRIFQGLLTTGMVSNYVLKWLEQPKPGTQDVLLELLVKHERPLRWNSQEDQAILEEALIKSDPECYKMVDLDLSDWEIGLVTRALYVDCSQFTTFKEVEAAVREKAKSILGRQLEIEYGEKYGSGSLSRIADPNLKAVIFFNQETFETVLGQDQNFEEAMLRAFFDKCLYHFPEKISEELKERAGSVIKAISDWYRLYTETKYGLTVKLSDNVAIESCSFYVLLRNEIDHEPNQAVYQEHLSKKLNLFLGSIGLNNSKKIVEQYQSVDQLRKMFEASLHDPTAKLAMMQPLLKVPAPWSIATFRKAISNDVPEGLFRDRLAIAPAGLFFKALGKHMNKNRDFFDPQKAEDREILERLMVKEDEDCVIAIMQINGLFFIENPKIECQRFNSYQEVFDELKKRLQE